MNIIKTLAISTVIAAAPGCAVAQLNLQRAASALQKGIQAATITDAQMAQYVGQAVQQMDAEAQIAPATSPYAQRLARLTDGLNDVNGIPLNFKVYLTDDVNAFACADGSVRVYSGIMDLMDDNELLGVIGHEIGHVAKHHSKNALKHELLEGALCDALASTSDKVATLTDSQLSQLGQAFSSAKYSRKQENEADDYGYKFLKDNNKNPWGMVQAFTKLQSLENTSGAQTTYFQKMFSSHPDTAKRIKNMTKKCKKDGIPYPTTEASTSTSTTSTTSTKASVQRKTSTLTRKSK